MKKISTLIITLIIALNLTAQNTKQVLHTVIEETLDDMLQSEYIYDEFGNHTRKISSIWNEDSQQWGLDYKIDQTYNTFGDLMSYETNRWNEATSSWGSRDRHEYICRFGDYLPDHKWYQWDSSIDDWKLLTHSYRTYDTNGNLIEEVNLREIPNIWSGKEEYIYDENDRLIQKTYSKKYWHQESWRLDWKEEYLYNSNNQQIETIYFEADIDQTWEIGSKSEYTYTSSGEETSHTTYRRVDSDWIPSTRVIKEYNVLGKMTLEAEQRWQEDTQIWESIKTVEYTYDSVGNQLSRIYTLSNSQNFTFNEGTKHEYEYDENNNVILYTSYYAEEPEQFIPHGRISYTYNNDYAYEDLITFEDYDYKNMLIERNAELWNSTINDWEFNVKYTYQYSPMEINPLPELGVDYVCINTYPNPATDYITFSVVGTSTPVRIRLFEATGKLIGEQMLNDDNTISTNNLQRGVYFYQLLYNGIQQGGKFMIK